ncbi:uncharacterized protein LOC114269036 [Camellia sinensis]|uniref:RNase H type-1 domain-containing protein n=1 Tax=Camellia sinensis TaxID=4442 RepID=A0A7J7G9N5_CAMSI|nr:uncharacterized protein LOC114269036 [Camellia sinensis]KAF5936026.1 hypothetical protein HYC85_027155 [Camellia sinensis]
MFSSDLGQFGFELVADCMDWLEIEWIHSFLGKINLNADSCAKTDWGKAGFRGLFKDEKKSWILGYSGKLDAATCLEAEIWAIYCGTTIIHEKGCKVLRLRRTVKSSKSDSKWCSPKLPIQSISGRYEILDSECDE